MDLRLTALAEAGEEPAEVARWTATLLQQLSDLDDVAIELEETSAPPTAKGLAAATHTLIAYLTKASALAPFMRILVEWATHANRSIEISLDGDVLKLTGASREQQQLVVEAFIARHPVP